MKLKDKVAIVTGAARGIGKAIALELAKQGANIIVNDYVIDENAEQTVKEIEALGVKATTFQCSVSDSAKVKEMFAMVVEKYSTVDILVNNAGITRDNLIIKMSEQDFDRVLDTNLKGTFVCTKEAVAIMARKRTGKIVNIASVNGIIGSPGQANYSSSKAGIIGLTKTIAKEVAKRNVNVNAVAPGFIQTDMTDKLDDKMKEYAIGLIPKKQMGQPEDVARAVSFLACSDSDYITGQVLKVDGGMVM